MKRYPAYKDSGVAWLGSIIGEVPAHWTVTKLKWVAALQYGDSLAAQDRRDGDVPVYGSNGIVGTHDYAITQSPCIIVGRKGSFGKVNLSEVPCFPIDTTFFIDSTSTSHSLYWLAYLLPLLGLDELSKDSAVPGLNREDAYANLVPLPSLREQTAIAAYLDRKTAQIDAVIARKERLIELLREERTAVISQAVTKGLNPNAPMKDSGVPWLGEVPAHWEMDRLRWSVTMCKNGIWGSEPEGEDGIICVRVADFDRDRSLVSLENPTLRSLRPSEKEDRILQPGDLLLEKSGGGERQPVGFVVLYDHDQEAVCSNFVARMPIAPEQDSRYWNYLNRYFYFARVNVRSIKQTTGIQNLDSYSYLSEQVSYPPLDEQTAIADHLDQRTTEVDQTIARTKAQIERLREYRTALISAVVTGKVDVREEAEE